MAFETIKIGDTILAIIVKHGEIKDKLNFITPENFPLQVGIHNREKDTYVKPHRHLNYDKLENFPVQEIFYIESGKIKVGLYHGGEKAKEIILSKGDLIILNSGHDVQFLEDSKMIEIKQGPYRGVEKEKVYL